MAQTLLPVKPFYRLHWLADGDTFDYDGLGRLTSATVSGKVQSYKYDAFGTVDIPVEHREALRAGGVIVQLRINDNLALPADTRATVRADVFGAGTVVHEVFAVTWIGDCIRHLGATGNTVIEARQGSSPDPVISGLPQ